MKNLKKILIYEEQWQFALELADLSEDLLCEINEYGFGCKPDSLCDGCKIRELAKRVKEAPNIFIEELED